MAWFSDFKGTMQQLLGIGGPTGIKLKHNSGKLEAKNAADNAFITTRVAKIASSSTTVNDVPTLLDLKGRMAVVEFAFDGATPTTPGANTDKFGFVHTTGGSYTAGQIVYDDGAALVVLPTDVVKHLTTALAVTGTISFINNGIYAWDAGSWVLKGDGNSTSEGNVRMIEVAYTHADTTKSSTTSLATGARVVKIANNVTTAFAGGTGTRTLQVEIDGTTIDTTILATTDCDINTADTYIKDAITVIDGTVVEPGVIKLTVAVPSGHSAGVGSLQVYYTSPNA
jgi:hypothetical protein